MTAGPMVVRVARAKAGGAAAVLALFLIAGVALHLSEGREDWPRIVALALLALLLAAMLRHVLLPGPLLRIDEHGIVARDHDPGTVLPWEAVTEVFALGARFRVLAIRLARPERYPVRARLGWIDPARLNRWFAPDAAIVSLFAADADIDDVLAHVERLRPGLVRPR